jgi:hypothetical protein
MLPAQSPAPVVVQAATPALRSSQGPASSENAASLQEALKMLREMKTANDEILRKQTATLEQLDEMEKLADQLRVLAKRG